MAALGRRIAALTVVCACLPLLALALDNGMGLTPAMGFSSWNACSSNVTSAYMRRMLGRLQSTGLAAKGYHYLNVDEGWLKARNASGGIVSDDDKFPEGMKAFGDWVHSQTYAPGKHFKYGLYTCRGTCQCSTPWYHGPGSQGYEKQDAQYMVDAGADYVKEDSCCGSQDHETAFSDYGRMRDALNATGRPVYFSLCGWNTWYAPVGYSLGNSWRISADGRDWNALSQAANKMNSLTAYIKPGGWNDPDLLIGPNVKVGGQTDLQSRTQFSLWTLFPAPLIISNDLEEASDYALETWGNEEAIAINQEPLAEAAFRLQGEDLAFPCGADGGLDIVVAPCNEQDKYQQWSLNSDGTISLRSNSTMVLDNFHCGHSDGNPVKLYPSDGTGGTCGGNNQRWDIYDNQTIVNRDSKTCLDAYDFAGPAVDTWTCNGGNNQQWVLDETTAQLKSASAHMCLAAVASCTNIWGRRLRDGSWGMVMVNNGADNTTVTCGPDCFAQTTLTSSGSLVVRDLWQHKNVTTITPSKGGFSLAQEVPGQGGARYFRLYPGQ